MKQQVIGIFILLLTVGCIEPSTDLKVAPTSTVILPSRTSTPPYIIKTTEPAKEATLPTVTTFFPKQMTPTLVSPPTLPPGEPNILVTNLLENNNGCFLPCWWGIMPGETTWQEAKRFLSQLDATFLEGGVIGNTPKEPGEYIGVKIPVPKYAPYARELFQDYTIRNGLVEEIEAYNYDLAPQYSLIEVLNSYGKPDEAWIITYRNEYMSSQPFLLYIFYSTKGILLEYGASEGGTVDDVVKGCFQKSDSPFIYLWATNHEVAFQDALRRFVDTENLPRPLPLKNASGMDLDTFYQKFKDPKNTQCIETPTDLWPRQ